MRTFREITTRDINQPSIQAFGQWWQVTGFIGRIMPCDVGKRIYKVADNSGGYFLQVENDSQFKARENKA